MALVKELLVMTCTVTYEHDAFEVGTAFPRPIVTTKSPHKKIPAHLRNFVRGFCAKSPHKKIPAKIPALLMNFVRGFCTAGVLCGDFARCRTV